MIKTEPDRVRIEVGNVKYSISIDMWKTLLNGSCPSTWSPCVGNCIKHWEEIIEEYKED